MKTILPKRALPLILLLLMHHAWAQKFVNPIPIPYTLSGTSFNLQVTDATHNFNPGSGQPSIQDSTNAVIPTRCYNQNPSPSNAMTYLGPTLIWQKGMPIQVNITNKLTERTTVHWHGLNLPSKWDGGPHEPIEINGPWNPNFTVIDPVQTVWYHSHLMDSTTMQVIQGLAGMIIIEDPADSLKKHLPHTYGKNDFPIVIQEKGFNYNGSKVTSVDINSGGSIANPGNGPYTVINGVQYGVLRVPKQVVRLRFLNGSHRKSFQVCLSTQKTKQRPLLNQSILPMYLVATDGGYTGQPYQMDSILFAPGERMEMLANFSSANNNDTIYLMNLSSTMPQGIINGPGNGPLPNQFNSKIDTAFLAIIVTDTIQPEDSIKTIPSASLFPSYTLMDTSTVTPERHRTKHLVNLTGGPGQGGIWTIDGDTMDMEKLNDTILVNTTEIWTIKNNTAVYHPFHIHKVQFQIFQYSTDTNSVGFLFPNLPNHLKGWKDDVLVPRYGFIKFATKFENYGDDMVDPMNGFMYHCHILTHEDHSMMHQFIVLDSAAYYMATGINKPKQLEFGNFTMYPNPAATNLYIKGESKQDGVIRITDLLGRTLKEENVSAFNGTTSILVGDLPRGMILVEWTSGNNRVVQKVFLK